MKRLLVVYARKDSGALVVDSSCNINELVFETEKLLRMRLVFTSSADRDRHLLDNYILVGML